MVCAVMMAALSALSAHTNEKQAYTSTGEYTTSIPTPKGLIEITPITPDIFRIEAHPHGRKLKFAPSQSGILHTQHPKINITADETAVSITSETTGIRIDRTTGSISFFNANGQLLISEAYGIDNRTENRRVTFITPPNDNFYGTGERGHKLRLNGDTLIMYNRQNYGYTGSDPRISQMNITVPYFTSSHGYGILFDDYNKALLILGNEEISYESDSPKPLAYWFINGNGTLAGTTDNYTLLTGRQPLPPFWALGYITSKYGYHNEQETIGATDTLKALGYPLDGIVLDLYWYGIETDMGRLEWDKQQWPNPRKMLSTLRNKGIKLITISQPYINKIGAIDNYNMLSNAGMLVKDSTGRTHDVTTWVGEAGMFDVSNPDTREWLWERYHSLTDDGIEGWWGDLGEPEVHPSTIVHSNGETAEQYHNVYGNEWSRILYDGFRRDYPERRLMLLMRGGTAGLQRYSVFPWSTDVSRSWDGYEPQVRIMLNSGLSGLGYMSSDLGGFAVDPENPTDPELYVRWIQMGAFTPTFRTHAQLKPEPYHYPEYEDILKKIVRTRYEWLPYNYTLAYENTTTGAPLVRPLNFRDSTAKSDAGNEYLWGDNVLVAPVFEQGATTRNILFPAGKWFSWNNPQESHKGPAKVSVEAPIDVLPLYIHEGSFIPQYKIPIANTEEYDPTYLTIKYFPSEIKTSYTLFDDDRHSSDTIENGNYQLTTFTGEAKDSRIAIFISSSGFYSNMPQNRIITLIIPAIEKDPKTVTLNIENNMIIPMYEKEANKISTSEYGWHFDSDTKTLTMRFPWDYKSIALEIE